MVKVSKRYHIRRKGTGKGKVRRNPGCKGIYLSIKCSRIGCPNEAVSYVSGGSYGLWACKEHGGLYGGTKVADIKRNPNHPNRWQLTDKFRNGKHVTERELSQERCGIGNFDWANLENDLKHFDYTYRMSDDFGVWGGGQKEEKRIRSEVKEAKQIDEARTMALIKRYRHRYGTQF